MKVRVGDCITIAIDVPESKVHRGMIGYVLEVNNDIIEVEVLDGEGNFYCELTLEEDEYLTEFF